MPAATDVLISIAQIALGGSVVQAGVAFFRRKPELRKLDEETDSIAVSTAEQVVLLLRAQLLVMKNDAEEQAGKLRSMVAQFDRMTEQLAAARQEIIHLKYPLKGD